SSASLMLEGLSEVAIGQPAFLAYRQFLVEELLQPELVAYVTWELSRHLGPLTDRALTHDRDTQCFDAISRLMPYPTVIPFMEELDFHRGWEEAELVFREVSEATINFMSQRGVTLPATDGHFELKLPTTNQLDAFYSEVGTNTKVQGKPTFMDKYLSTLSNIRSKEIFSILQVEEPSTSYPLPPLYGRHAQASFQ
ncbi:hypothetical protein MTO96_043399, partial [Rhipicephalus appendiculatus]